MECGKVKYWTRSEAKDQLKIINKRNPLLKLKDVYYCEGCGMWHHTSLSKIKSRNLTRKKNNNGNRG